MSEQQEFKPCPDDLNMVGCYPQGTKDYEFKNEKGQILVREVELKKLEFNTQYGKPLSEVNLSKFSTELFEIYNKVDSKVAEYIQLSLNLPATITDDNSTNQ